MPRIVPAIFLFSAVIYAPLAYGCTTVWGIGGLDMLLLLMVVSWGLLKMQDKEGFSIPPYPAAVVLLLLLIAIAQVFNSHAVFDPETWDLRKLAGGIPLLPRTMDRATSLALLPHLLVLALSFLAVIDLCHSRRTRWSILRAVAISGVLVALYGIVQKVLGEDRLLWAHVRTSGPTYFAAFRYQGNAASFLNLCWPAALALFLRSCLEEKRVSRNLWGLAWLFTFGALFANTSKFGHAAALPLLLVAGIVCFRLLPRDWFLPRWRNVLGFLVVAGVLAALTLPALRQTLSHWQACLEDGLTLKLRQTAYETCLTMIREAPLFGFGTGSFRILFPYYTVSLGEQVAGKWSHAHQDYLETIIEWGWMGAAIWAGLLVPPVVSQFVRSLGSRADLAGSAALIGIVATLAHSMVDFPLQIASIHFYFLLFLAFLWRSRKHSVVPEWARI